MLLNTKTGELKMTKTEIAALDKAAGILRLIEQHSFGKGYCDVAGEAHAAIHTVLVGLGAHKIA